MEPATHTLFSRRAGLAGFQVIWIQGSFRGALLDGLGQFPEGSVSRMPAGGVPGEGPLEGQGQIVRVPGGGFGTFQGSWTR